MEPEQTRPFLAAMKNRLAIAAVSLMSFAGLASAAIDFSNITDLIDAVVGLIPSLMSLVIEIAPLIVTMAIITFLVSFFRDTILGMLRL